MKQLQVMRDLKRQLKDQISRLCGIVSNLPESIETDLELNADVYLELEELADLFEEGRKAMNKTKIIFESKLGTAIDGKADDLPCTDAGPYLPHRGLRLRTDPGIFVHAPSRQDPEKRKEFFDALAKDPRFSKFLVQEVQDKALSAVVQTILLTGEFKDLPPILHELVSTHTKIKVTKGAKQNGKEKRSDD